MVEWGSGLREKKKIIQVTILGGTSGQTSWQAPTLSYRGHDAWHSLRMFSGEVTSPQNRSLDRQPGNTAGECLWDHRGCHLTEHAWQLHLQQSSAARCAAQEFRLLPKALMWMGIGAQTVLFSQPLSWLPVVRLYGHSYWIYSFFEKKDWQLSYWNQSKLYWR